MSLANETVKFGTAHWAAGRMAHILDLIRTDHDFIRNILEELAGNPDTRDIRRLTLHRELLGHLYAEEVTLYARLRGAMPEEIGQSIREHGEIRDLLARLDVIPLGDVAWMLTLTELRDRIGAHFVAEEDGIFPRAEHNLSRRELFELSEGFESEKQKMAEFPVV